MPDEEKKIDYYGTVLAQLRAKRDQLDAAIGAIEALGGVADGTSLAPVTQSPGNRGGSGEIASDAFFGMSVLDATEKLLGVVKKPQSANAIANALEKGGLVHQSGNFTATVYTTLRRAEERGDRVTKVQKNWGLANWYPNRPRTREEPAQSKKAKKKAKKPTAAKVMKPVEVVPTPEASASGAQIAS